MTVFRLQSRLSQLTESKASGKTLDQAQLDAIGKLPEVAIQLELMKELQKQFTGLQTEVVGLLAHMWRDTRLICLFSLKNKRKREKNLKSSFKKLPKEKPANHWSLTH